jgi:hypothetical protein
MKKILLSALVLLLFASAPLLAQRSSEAGAFIGVSNYMGDFAPSPIAANETNLAFGGHYRYFINPQIGLKGSVTFAKISGDYQNIPQATLERKMEASLLEIGIQGEWHFLATPRFNNAGLYARQASPFIGVGLAAAFGDSEVIAPNNDKTRFPEADDKSAFIVFPITLGMRFDIAEYLILTGEFGLRATVTDYLDGVSMSGNPDTNDHYFFGGISVLYLIEAEYGPSYRN